MVPAIKCGANRVAPGERLCGRTIKFCSAVLHGQWIVSSSWLRESTRHGYWVAEETHEVHGDNSTLADGRGAGGPRRGRIRRECDGPRLFDGLRFHLHGAFVKPTRRELGQLVCFGGGVLVERWAEVARASTAVRDTVVVYAELQADDTLVARCAELGVPAPVHVDWIFDSISRHEPSPRPELGALESDATASQQSEIF